MSFEIRNNTAMSKRAEQLRRWEESDTAREPDYPKNEAGRRIKFSSGCVFLAACLSGERDEVLRLLEQGADIDTANTDGLTALHQVSKIIPNAGRGNDNAYAPIGHANSVKLVQIEPAPALSHKPKLVKSIERRRNCWALCVHFAGKSIQRSCCVRALRMRTVGQITIRYVYVENLPEPRELNYKLSYGC